MSTPVFPAPINVEVMGNKDLVPERITSFEFGYQGRLGARLRGGVDLFFNKLDDLIFFGVTDTYNKDYLFPGSPGGIIPRIVSTLNKDDIKTHGGEIAASYSIAKWLSAYVNYSYQYVTDSRTGERIESAPQHKINPALRIKPGKSHLVNLFANYVSRTHHDNEEIETCIMHNFAISCELGGNEIGLSVSNILDNKHLEHPDGNEIGRSMILSLMHRI
jgi:outer membrane receptor protein involved in Fe transport